MNVKKVYVVTAVRQFKVHTMTGKMCKCEYE